MKKILMAFIALAPLLSHAQFKQVLIEEVDNGGKVKGRTYRIYAEMTSVKDQVYVIYGDSANPLIIKSSKPFFQSDRGGASSRDSNRKTATEHDSLRYDSWITIGAADNYENNTQILNVSFDEFEKKGGAIEIPKDGAWFCVPTDRQAWCDDSKKILLMQLTTDGEITGQFNIMGKSAAGQTYTKKDVKFTCGSKGKSKK